MRHYYSLTPAAAVRPGFDGHSYVKIPHDMPGPGSVIVENFNAPRMMRWTSDCFVRNGEAWVLFAKRGDALPLPDSMPFGVSMEQFSDTSAAWPPTSLLRECDL